MEVEPNKTAKKGKHTPEPSVAERQHAPELVVPEQPPEAMVTEERQSTPEAMIIEECQPTPEVIPESESSESFPVISQSASNESVSSSLGIKDRDTILDLFRAQDMQDVDTTRFKMDPLAGQAFYNVGCN